jgi:2-phosphosulfolactate phosphatase
MQRCQHDQASFDIRCEWGLRGVEVLAPISDVVVIVDVLSFSTCVDVTVGRGALVLPHRWKDASAATFAAERKAKLAGRRGSSELSLSPPSMMRLSAGDRVVLPSPNGSTLTLSTGDKPTLCGCLRNAAAVARQAMAMGRRVAVIPAGERWHDDDSLRPAVEDWLGAGAIIASLNGSRSPEAAAAVAVFEAARSELAHCLTKCSSGRELMDMGYEADVACAAELDVSTTCPILHDGAYVAV